MASRTSSSWTIFRVSVSSTGVYETRTGPRQRFAWFVPVRNRDGGVGAVPLVDRGDGGDGPRRADPVRPAEDVLHDRADRTREGVDGVLSVVQEPLDGLVFERRGDVLLELVGGEEGHGLEVDD